MLLLMFIGTQSVVLLFLPVLVVMCIVFQMLFATMLFPWVLIRDNFIELGQLRSSPVLLLLFCFILQVIRCSWVMRPYPNHYSVHPRYSP